MTYAQACFYAPFVVKPTIITAPGTYRTRSGGRVEIAKVSVGHDHGCIGTYESGVSDGWHKSGAIYGVRQTDNDIIEATA